MTDMHNLREEVFALVTRVEESVSLTTTQRQAIFEQCNALYQHAAVARDDVAMTTITDLWHNVEILADEASVQAERQVATLKVASEAVQQRDIIHEQWESLSGAIRHIDTAHPQIAHLASIINARAEEAIADEYQERMESEVVPEIQQRQREEINLLLYNNLAFLTECSDQAIAGFMRMLMGKQGASDYQVAMLAELVGTFAERVEEVADGHE